MRRWIGGMMLLTLALVWLGGCQTVAAPETEVQSVAVTQQTGEGARLEVLVLVHNRNDFALPVRSASYDVRVSGLGRFSFTDEPPVTLPPNDSQSILLAAAYTADPDAVEIDHASAVRISGRLWYQPPGDFRELLTEYHFPLPSVTFGQRATLDELTGE
ncbi:hypothetical protein ACERK3_02655 [Phycisphaerales bacterium AB-hyl4]|uniref:Water stress and hypersensitive response domain-containing protein n=1 Tax=Natronomicrosphaera hydrolytica TaxID=3242702 RepID=A0ABV4U4F3_9BACT